MLAVQTDIVAWLFVSTQVEILKLLMCQVTELVYANGVGSYRVILFPYEFEIILECIEACKLLIHIAVGLVITSFE